jgi:small subunit ribosomal protein S6
MNDYELLYIITPRKAPADVDAVIEWVGQQVTSAGGETLATNNWGRRRLAYPINHHLEGTYVLQHLRMPSTAAVSLESALHITEDVIRHMLTRDIVNPDTSAPPEYVGERPRFGPRASAPAPAAEAPVEAAPVAEAPAAEPPADVAATAEAPEAPAAEAAPAEPVEEPAPAATE